MIDYNIFPRSKKGAKEFSLTFLLFDLYPNFQVVVTCVLFDWFPLWNSFVSYLLLEGPTNETENTHPPTPCTRLWNYVTDETPTLSLSLSLPLCPRERKTDIPTHDDTIPGGIYYVPQCSIFFYRIFLWDCSFGFENDAREPWAWWNKP